MAKITGTAICALFIFFSFTCCLPPLAGSLSFDYPTFRSEDQKAIKIEGNASFSVGHIDISGNNWDVRKSQGRASYSTQPMLLWDGHTGEVASFTTSFSFIIKPKSNSSRGAGMAFFLASYPSSLPTGSAGYYNLGLTNQKDGAVAAGDNRFVAVEFDTSNETEVSDPDTTVDHVGIDINSLKSVKTLPLPNFSLTGNMTAAIQYDNISSIMSVTLWLGDGHGPIYRLSSKVDLKSALPELVAVGFSASTGKSVELHQLLSWHFNSSLEGKTATVVAPPVLPPPSSRTSSSGVIAGAVAGASLFLVVFFSMSAFLLRRRQNKKKREAKDEGMDSEGEVVMEMEFGTGPRRFPYRQLTNATRNFAAEEKLGQGGFGAVYRGHLRELGLAVAIKRFSKESSMQGRKEYTSEINVISRLRHRNLVQLVGWCHNHDELLLVYELMPNRSLDIHLHGKGTFLTWAMRMKIVLELGSALLYLHEEWEQCEVHRDIKPSNVMLDESFGAKLGDFGLARLIDHAVRMQTMTIVSGTPGYVDPQCLITGRASSESDVYSFGVVLLEVACGKRPMSTSANKQGVSRLTEWVWDLYGEGGILEAVDERLNGHYDEAEVERVMVVGLWCAHPDSSVRPSIRTAMATLVSKDAKQLPVLPAKMPVPTYAPPMAPWDGQSSSSGLSTSTVTRSSTTSGYTGPAPMVTPRA
ncbi:L-type lectin-domain containing receptor kinase IX.1 [Aegilops tauschii subsp. strangulata]|uniref:non-specific serine/threonine protein kinase n=2 Tax=Aegilops tauschii subsp. strangulata TaxID=200361 RepID=A0A453S133_AEGTS|nr:L-type lectin-domain containing receptor kinase IX.1 [Aegilops tauschii subsp. strangulata]